jgi:predicted enzyme related to lactoylglutathione lyase
LIQIGIVPRDFEAAMAFYRDNLELPYRGSGPALEGRTLHFFEAQGGILKVLELGPGDPAPALPPPDQLYHAATGMRWLTLDVVDLDAVMKAVGDVPVQLPITEVRPGLRVAIVSDPDGNAVELVEGAPPRL